MKKCFIILIGILFFSCSGIEKAVELNPVIITPVITSADELRKLLSTLRDNTTAAPYIITLNVSELAGIKDKEVRAVHVVRGQLIS